MFNLKSKPNDTILSIFRTLLVGILFIGCQPNKQTAQIQETNDLIQQEAVPEKETIPDITTVEENDFEYTDCKRGQADAVIKKTIYPNATFKLGQNNQTGTENVTFDNGDKLTIRNWGCEYYMLTFRFETSRFSSDTTDVKYWLEKVTVLMSEIENGIDAPLNIAGGTKAILRHLQEKKDYNLGQEIDYNNDVIRDFVSLDRIQKINANTCAVEISYATGPL